MSDDTSRRSVAIVVSLAFHAALLAVLSMMAGRALVQLAVEPTPVLLTLVDVAERTAGPGHLAPELRVAAPAVVSAPPAPLEPVAPAAESAAPASESAPPDVEPEVVASPAEKIREPPRFVAPRPKPSAKKLEPAPSRPAPASGDIASLGSAPAASTGSGTDTRSTAPAWAPSARLRYEEMLFAWMNRHKQYPLLAQRRGLEGTGSVRVRIDRDGRVIERSVHKSTGETMLDQAALDMVRRASPFPAVPPEYAGEGFEFVAPIQYRLH